MVQTESIVNNRRNLLVYFHWESKQWEMEAWNKIRVEKLVSLKTKLVYFGHTQNASNEFIPI